MNASARCLQLAVCGMMAAVAFAPLVASASQVEVAEIHHDGVVDQQGDLLLMALHGQGDSQTAPWVHLEAEALTGWRFSESGVLVDSDSAGVGQGVERPCEEANTEQLDVCLTETYGEAEPLHAVSMLRTDASPAYIIHVFTLSGQTAGLEAKHTGAVEQVVREAGINPEDRIADHPGSDHIGDDEVSTFPQSMRRTLTAPSIVDEVKDDDASLVVRGDFVMEVRGVDFRMTHSDGAQDVVTMRQEEPIAGRPEAEAREYESHLARFVVEGGTLTFHRYGGDGLSQWALGRSHVSSLTGPLSLVDAVGTLETQDGPIALDHVLHRHEGAYELVTSPGPERLAVQYTELDDEGHPVTAAAVTAAFPTVAVSTAITLLVVLLLVVGVALALRWTGATTMHEVEAALQGKNYRRAAWLSNRIIRKDPRSESARLSRAIALSRAGQPAKVVRELASFLRLASPRDGTLHYVLGLAYQDIGDDESATIVMAEAVRLTPSLAPQVDAAKDTPSKGDQHAYA